MYDGAVIRIILHIGMISFWLFVPFYFVIALSAFYARVDTVISRHEMNSVSCIPSFPMLQYMMSYFVVVVGL